MPNLFSDLSLIQDWLECGRKRPVRIPVIKNTSEVNGTSVDNIEKIVLEIKKCDKCRLSAKRKNTVPGEGCQKPIVMVIGEGPGADEDETGKPFVGAAGKLLDKMLSSIGLSRETNVFIGNIVKCRPPMNRDPVPDEQEACLPYLYRQINILKPKYILSVGRVSTQALIGQKEGITKLRGRFYTFEGLPLLATFHPSALLRDESLKRPVWEDLKLFRDRILKDGIKLPELSGSGS